MMRFYLVAILLAYGGVAHATESAKLPITVQGTGPYYKLVLPIAAYGLSNSEGLSDLRIRNAAGQAIPFAWVSTDEVKHTIATNTVPLFALPATTTTNLADDSEAFVILANGALQPVKKMTTARNAVNNWLIDASQIRGRLLQAHFEFPPEQYGVFALQLETSDDLTHWQPLGDEEQLLRLSHNKQTIERLTIDLGGMRTHFLRLRWLNAQHGINLTKVTIDSVDDAELSTAVQWTDYLAPEQCAENYCDYKVASAGVGGVPINSLKVQLSQSNTLASIFLYGIGDEGAPQERPLYKTRNPLYALRHQHRPPPREVSPRETLIADGIVYRLSYPKGEVFSDALQLNGSTWKKLRLRTTGPMSILGTPAPKLSIAVPLKTLVFLGQGAGPYYVGTAEKADVQKIAVGVPLTLTRLIPNYKPALLATMEQATVALPTVVAIPNTSVASARPIEAMSNRRTWLWIVLVVGLLMLAGMAWSLLKSLRRD